LKTDKSTTKTPLKEVSIPSLFAMKHKPLFMDVMSYVRYVLDFDMTWHFLNAFLIYEQTKKIKNQQDMLDACIRHIVSSSLNIGQQSCSFGFLFLPTSN